MEFESIDQGRPAETWVGKGMTANNVMSGTCMAPCSIVLVSRPATTNKKSPSPAANSKVIATLHR